MNRIRSIFTPRRLLTTKRAIQHTAVATTAFTLFFGGGSVLFYCIFSNVSYHPVRGSSMSPALSPDYAETGAQDTVFVSRWTYDGAQWRIWPFRPFYEDLKRGDVVMFTKPHDSQGLSIKRVVGLPGDKVVRTRKRIERNIKLSRKLGFDTVPDEVTVPMGHVWVEGDNWRDTFDSNDFGPIPINLIFGRAVGVIWPRNRYGLITPRNWKKGSRTGLIEGVPPDDDAWKEIYNYD
jgi:inner membrane protease subunit 2